jgi:predicted Zn finger-like uncharacterized protein
MLLTCPNCDTVFRVDGEKIGEAGQAVRCSVCAHVWQAAPPMLVSEAEPGEMAGALRTVIGSFLVMIVLLGSVVGLVVERATITAYAPGLLGVFDRIGPFGPSGHGESSYCRSEGRLCRRYDASQRASA